MTQNELITNITDAIHDRKGRAVTILDFADVESAPAPAFIICTGTSTMQAAAIADSVRDTLLERHGTKPYNYDGYGTSRWIVIDYGSVLVHVFVPEERERYRLEDLWNDARVIEIPDLD